MVTKLPQGTIIDGDSIVLSLATCRKLYEDHYQKGFPSFISFADGAWMVRRAIGEKQFLQRLEQLGIVTTP